MGIQELSRGGRLSFVPQRAGAQALTGASSRCASSHVVGGRTGLGWVRSEFGSRLYRRIDLRCRGCFLHPWQIAETLQTMNHLGCALIGSLPMRVDDQFGI